MSSMRPYLIHVAEIFPGSGDRHRERGEAVNELRTAADFVAAVCGLTHQAEGTSSALIHAAANVRGPGAEELRQAVSGRSPEASAPDSLDELAFRWTAPCLASLAVAIRSSTSGRSGIGAMRDYLVASAVTDANRAVA